ncbi:ribonuclease HI family protein [Pseudogracilibacillus auburnensis]|uniref:ribonuclease HI family protein n=1 Tax=Pseudogracilibacillus auburnensis TaxID=1494959 RepID=UPI001A97A08D|nr:ribonuclease HI family protein [Pseudogracilibacillus auburnensis]MBO1001727.1 ribonuclease HI family protein [Pseudogracilibacillus auburnensis]
MIEVYTDGASNGNPGVSGAGIYIKANGKMDEYSLSLGMMSNHEAEFYAVIKALEICDKQFPGEILSFQSDSQVVVDTIDKNFTKNKVFQPLLAQIMEKAHSFPYFFIKWIPSKHNIHADQLAKKAIRMQLNHCTS